MQSIRRPGWHRSARALCMHVIRAAARLLRRVGPGPFGRGAPMPIISPLSFASRGFPRFAWARPALSARRCPHNQRPGWHGLLCGYAPAGCSPLSFASRRFRRFARCLRPGWHRAAFQLCTLAPIALCPAVSHGLPKPPLPYPGRAAAQTPSPLLSFDVCGQNPYFVSTGLPQNRLLGARKAKKGGFCPKWQQKARPGKIFALRAFFAMQKCCKRAKALL